MAIFSLNHSSLGKSTQAQPHTAGAHIQYITREKAMSFTLAGRMPIQPGKAQAFLNSHENNLRKNGRIVDKILLALPRELTADQRKELVQEFAERVTAGRASWFAAFHDKGKDGHNPHCHLIVVDRDHATGRRVFGMSDKGSTKRLRIIWETSANQALERAKRVERIDHRTLKAQGIRRQPTIHIGVRARQLVRLKKQVVSRDRIQRNHCQAQTRSRNVDYPGIDRGESRFAFNVAVRQRNYRQSVVADQEADYWKAIDEDVFIRDINELKRLNAVLKYSDDGQQSLRTRDELSLSSGRKRRL